MNEAPVEAWTERRFPLLIGAAVALGAAIRLRYVLTDRRPLIGGDGFDYHFSALRLADGLGYTSGLGKGLSVPAVHHPPGWMTLLGVVSWLGARSLRDHQLVGVVIGLGIVLLAGLIGRRYFSARVGCLAAVLAALYPGFWVIEGNVLSEPLGLLLLGVLTLAVLGLRDRPTLRRSVAVGAICGLLALVRSEDLALLVLVVVPVLLTMRAVSWRTRLAFLAASVVACGLVITPWAAYTATRFKDPVFLSTNGGSTLLAGNCPPFTYSGTLLGYYDTRCVHRLSQQNPGLDLSQRDKLARDVGVHNLSTHLDRLPIVIPARFGRMLAIFRPSQTVALVATWMTTGHRPIWAWVVSYWALLPLALLGGLSARRSGVFLLPLVAPLLIVAAEVALSYGEPRYHTPSDLGVVVLAAAGVDRLLSRRSASVGEATTPTGAQPQPEDRLEEVHVP